MNRREALDLARRMEAHAPGAWRIELRRWKRAGRVYSLMARNTKSGEWIVLHTPEEWQERSDVQPTAP